MNSPFQIFLISAAGLACASGQFRSGDPLRDRGEKSLRVYNVWTTFLHPRFGFELPIPPGVSAMGHPEAADEPRFQSADRNFVMSAWGGTTRDHPAKVIAAQWNSAQRQAGREITYQRRGQTWFVVSGTDRRGIEFYEKFTMRGQQVAFLDITFPRSLMARYEGWVEQIENGFRPVAMRGGISELPPVNRRQPAESARERTPEPLKRSPEPAPIAPEPKLTQRPPKKSPDVKVAPSSDESLPSAEKVAGKSGFVYSPFSADKRIVDVTDVPSGTKVKCPYTMKIFRVP